MPPTPPEPPSCGTSAAFPLIVKTLQAGSASSFYFKRFQCTTVYRLKQSKTGEEELSDRLLLVTAGVK